MTKQLKTAGKGKYTYDSESDLLIFKIEDREYHKSIEFGNLVIDLDPLGILSGIRVFDASVVFNVSKNALAKVKKFKLTSNIAKKGISLHIKFESKKQNEVKTCEQNFVTGSLSDGIQDSEMTYTA